MALCVLTAGTAMADVEINETNFPNKNFRNWVMEQTYGQDGVLTDEEIAGITSIEVNAKKIESLKGIEFFTALRDLECMSNLLTTLDASGCAVLMNLDCSTNSLTSIDVSGRIANPTEPASGVFFLPMRQVMRMAEMNNAH